jgi:hypothetical protein
MKFEVSGTPTTEETAALVAALEVLWPKPSFGSNAPLQSATNNWRFSGRWWATHDISRRSRPVR